MDEYWRWWVVHLWVEGFFEVFATVVMAFLFTRMGLLRTRTSTASVLFSTVIFLFGGIIGTFTTYISVEHRWELWPLELYLAHWR